MEKPIITAGVLSDTHLPYRMKTLPPAVMRAFVGVDIILHAGDVDRSEFLAPLRDIAPVHAVRGNVHLADGSSGGRDLPLVVQLTLAGREVVVVHGHQQGMWGALRKIPDIFLSAFVANANSKFNRRISRRLHREFPHADVVIFGHTHAPFEKRLGDTLFFNPGAVAPTRHMRPSIGFLRFWQDRVETEIVFLKNGRMTNSE